MTFGANYELRNGVWVPKYETPAPISSEVFRPMSDEAKIALENARKASANAKFQGTSAAALERQLGINTQGSASNPYYLQGAARNSYVAKYGKDLEPTLAARNEYDYLNNLLKNRTIETSYDGKTFTLREGNRVIGSYTDPMEFSKAMEQYRNAGSTIIEHTPEGKVKAFNPNTGKYEYVTPERAKRFEAQTQQLRPEKGNVTAYNPNTGKYESMTPERAKRFEAQTQQNRPAKGNVTALNPETGKYESVTPEKAKEFAEKANNRPTGNNPTGNNPTGSNPTGNNPTGNNPTGNNPTGSNPTGNSPTGSNPAGNNPTGNTSSNKPSANKSAAKEKGFFGKVGSWIKNNKGKAALIGLAALAIGGVIAYFASKKDDKQVEEEQPAVSEVVEEEQQQPVVEEEEQPAVEEEVPAEQQLEISPALKGSDYWKYAEMELIAEHKDEAGYKPSDIEIYPRMKEIMARANVGMAADGIHSDPMLMIGDDVKVSKATVELINEAKAKLKEEHKDQAGYEPTYREVRRKIDEIVAEKQAA